mgnify:CR=1 FL=1|tara:strand:+ start:4041 stop:4379 length:339 start_codon:yes stop_codon:yes gene_type:complete
MPNWRANSLRLGAMRERITIQSPVETVDTIGQTNRTWADTYEDEPARYDPISGGETLRGKQVEAGVIAVFTIHKRDDIDSTMRVSYGGNHYGIAYVNPVDGGNRYLELRCSG